MVIVTSCCANASFEKTDQNYRNSRTKVLASGTMVLTIGNHGYETKI